MSVEICFNRTADFLRRTTFGTPRPREVAVVELRSLVEYPFKSAWVAFQRSLVVALHSRKMQTVQYGVYVYEVSSCCGFSYAAQCSCHTSGIDSVVVHIACYHSCLISDRKIVILSWIARHYVQILVPCSLGTLDVRHRDLLQGE